MAWTRGWARSKEAPSRFAPLKVREQRTPGWLHALGDAGGKHQLTHMGKYQAKQFAAEFLGQQLHELSTEPPTPQVVFTDPQVASVGLTEEAATDAGYDVVTGEMRHAATIAITAQVPVSTLQHAVPVFPTASEVWVGLLDQVTE